MKTTMKWLGIVAAASIASVGTFAAIGNVEATLNAGSETHTYLFNKDSMPSDMTVDHSYTKTTVVSSSVGTGTIEWNFGAVKYKSSVEGFVFGDMTATSPIRGLCGMKVTLKNQLYLSNFEIAVREEGTNASSNSSWHYLSFNEEGVSAIDSKYSYVRIVCASTDYVLTSFELYYTC